MRARATDRASSCPASPVSSLAGPNWNFTSLFDINTALDQVVLQSPPNAGSLAATGKTTVDGKTDVGFDVYSSAVNGRVQSNLGFAVVPSGGVSRFYSVNLLTGRLTFMGRFATEVIDIAVPLAQ